MSVAAAAPAGTWTVDKVHSSVGFEVEHMVSTFRGRFEDYDVQLADGKLLGTVAVPSVRVYEENLEAHLQSPEFFDAERHPELRFESRELVIDGEGDVTVEGDLTIKGITRPVTATGVWTPAAEDAFGNTRAHLALEATVDRTEFDMHWNMELPSGGNVLANEVTLTIDASLTQA